jgi:hypothetical protein
MRRSCLFAEQPRARTIESRSRRNKKPATLKRRSRRERLPLKSDQRQITPVIILVEECVLDKVWRKPMRGL